MENNCEHCVFYCVASRKNNGKTAASECRLNPPEVFVDISSHRSGTDIVVQSQKCSGWPEVQPSHWCGQFISKPESPEEIIEILEQQQ